MIIPHKIDKRVNAPCIPGQLDDDGIPGVVHALGLIGLHRRQNIAAAGRVVLHLNQQQLPADRFLRLHVLHRRDHRQFIQLLHQLLLGPGVAVEADGNAGVIRRLRLAHRQGVDIELPAAEHAGDPVQYAELVLYQHRYDIPIHLNHPPLQ